METSAGDTGFQARRRRLPHWTATGCTYFVTFRTRTRILSEPERGLIREHICAGNGRFYDLSAVVVIPDHVHLILRPRAGHTLSRIMQGVKGASAHKLNAAGGVSGPVWQDESWDRILRNHGEFEEKLNYVLNNPVKAGLCADGWEYSGWFYNPDFEP